MVRTKTLSSIHNHGDLFGTVSSGYSGVLVNIRYLVFQVRQVCTGVVAIIAVLVFWNKITAPSCLSELTYYSSQEFIRDLEIPYANFYELQLAKEDILFRNDRRLVLLEARSGNGIIIYV